MRPLPFPLAAIADLDVLGETLVPRVAACVRGGLRWVVLRAKRAATAERLLLGRALLDCCPGLWLTLHGDPAGAEALGAPGIHLPSRGFDVAEVRFAHPSRLLGVSCHDAAEVSTAEMGGADYAFLSPFRAPTSKPAERPHLGPEGFSEVARSSALPLLALGGIGPGLLRAAAEAGAAGAAILGALFLAEDVEAAARGLTAEAETWFHHRGPGASGGNT